MKESDEKPDSVDESRSDDGEQVEIIDEQPISQQKGSRKNSNQIKVRSSKKSDNDTLRQPIVKNSKDENSAENKETDFKTVDELSMEELRGDNHLGF